MSGPTWPHPKTPGSPERLVPQMSDSGSAVYRQPPKKVSPDARPKYVVHDQNRGGGGMATRYLATRSTAGPMQHHHQEDPGFHSKYIDHYYQPPPQGLKEDQSLNPQMDRYQLMHRGPPKKLIGHHSSSDAEIDSLTCMLADLDSNPQNRAQNPDMSGPTWPHLKTPGSPERPVPQMSDSGPAVYRQPPKKVSSDTRPKYVVHDQNRGGGMATRNLATRSTAGPMQHHHQEDPGFHSKSIDHYYQPPPQELEEDQSLNPHMDRYQLMHPGPPKKLIGHHSNSDAEIDSLTCMLADLDSHPQNSAQLYDNDHISGDRYKASAQPGASAQGRPSMGFPSHPQPQYRRTPPYPSDPHQSLQYFPQPHDTDAQVSKRYPQPVPASYTTALTGPRFSVQVKTAQPVTASQTGRQAEHAYTPPSPRQHALRSPPKNQTGPQGWYPPHPASQVQELHSERGYKESVAGSGGRVIQWPMSNRGPEIHQSGSGSAPSSAYQPSKQGTAALRPEEELVQLTKKFVYDMNHPLTEEDFGRCARCGNNVLGDGSGCIAMEQVFHLECITCITCHTRLQGKTFYALDKQSYCESCYISILERCFMCSKPILDRVLRSMGKAYHARCFNCVACGCSLDGVPFTVDATSQIHCMADFYRKFSPRCSVCRHVIVPELGQNAAVSIVALGRSFHVNCYGCEECGLLLSSEGEERVCYLLDGHILCQGCSARHIQIPSPKNLH
uniref:thyroid receptor-interacting protein 6-like isoform X1 n=1 Tax=Oncorhynchus gorbuscha TaxID=8017 RepID=UPI001EAEF95E|nr:thyroid receptor-interacting protein 6-like isoform X1 [Oncorhynchus gorbuscha]